MVVKIAIYLLLFVWYICLKLNILYLRFFNQIEIFGAIIFLNDIVNSIIINDNISQFLYRDLRFKHSVSET